MNYRFTVLFSTLFSTTRISFRKTELYSLADATALGFAISMMTSARVVLWFDEWQSSSTGQPDLNGLCRISVHRKILRMKFFHLHHPPDVTVLCDRKGCEQVADYLEVDDHGHEYRVCASHTDSKTHASRLPTRKPSPDLPFRSRPPA
jgi:hypothetical protein